MRFDPEANTYWFRQSWLGTAITCPERGRRAIVNPEMEFEGDAANAGTAAHAAIQAFLEGEIDVDSLGPRARREALDLADQIDIRYVSFADPDEMAQHAAKCAVAWGRDILPDLTLGGLCEVPFRVKLFERDSGVSVGIEGTADYLPPIDGMLMDWKTSGREYKQWEKQRWAIQATVYAAAAVNGAFASAWEAAGCDDYPIYEFPMLFSYGVMVRGSKRAEGQIVPVARTRGHQLWLHDKLNRFIDQAEVMTLDREWITNETHTLCSEKWCPFWSKCQGRYLSTAEHTWRPVRVA